ncbi:hypothetical protein NCCP2495_05900 [Dietzia sp. NCCP-2495]|uniref:hypothetical protein n=1 Tax=Dietzia sp. NCCP-2495 TaxID=2934675 RepID=UPI00222EDFB5|nr:hypothetical protein [Dietzia sp. NCCP-2495]GLB62712.1 hypothetical protein NCCP2495_05900 [Dietzia sp. NCCP-2495]
MSRFQVKSLFSAHWKGLSQETDGSEPVPDWYARSVLLAGATIAGLAGLFTQAPLGEPSLRLAAFALLTGSLLTVFAQLSSLRLKLTEWFSEEDIGHRVEKNMIDESVAHVLFAAMLSLVAAGVTAVDAAVPALGKYADLVINALLAGVTFSLIYYIVALVVLTLPRLYGAYVAVNDVSRDLNGTVRDNRLKPMKRR